MHASAATISASLGEERMVLGERRARLDASGPEQREFRLGTLTPYEGSASLTAASGHSARARGQMAPEASLSLEGTRSESDGSAPENGVMLRGALSW